jgi:hypothetical protein
MDSMIWDFQYVIQQIKVYLILLLVLILVKHVKLDFLVKLAQISQTEPSTVQITYVLV